MDGHIPFVYATFGRRYFCIGMKKFAGQACKLAPDIGHLSGKFEGFDWRILSLTGHFDWALPL